MAFMVFMVIILVVFIAMMSAIAWPVVTPVSRHVMASIAWHIIAEVPWNIPPVPAEGRAVIILAQIALALSCVTELSYYVAHFSFPTCFLL
jgi:hypothetical protein